MEKPDFLLSGEAARLIPILPDGQRECRTTSIILAGMMAVPEFGRKLLATAGVRVGKTTSIECFTEIVLKNASKQTKDRPDGLIVLKTGKKVWRALIEAKAGTATLDKHQIETYVQLAKQSNIDAIITISNQFAALPTHHPVDIPKRGLSGIELFHWSWTYILTEATLLLTSSELKNPDHKYLLSEIIRYLRSDRSGVTRFDRMNAEWKDLISAIQNRAPLDKRSDLVTNSVASWFQEQRDISLLMSRKLGKRVSVKLSRTHTDSPEERLNSEIEQLVEKHQLKLDLDIPNAASPVEIIVDLLRRSVICSMRLEAPKDKKSPSARLNWLLRQLPQDANQNIHIRANWPGRTPPSQATLKDIRENSDCLIGSQANSDLRSFDVMLVVDMAADLARTTKFIEKIEKIIPAYYEQVGQHLRAWVAPPPKIRRDVSEDPVPAETYATEHSDEVSKLSAPAEETESHSTAENLSRSAALSPDDESLEIPDFLIRNTQTA
ncbi:hypothetical protein [Tepidicaulis sp.]|uniref:hypothetical protein n=1 Tax=Tepidicaulis sp. TaxID=1920809 RepID=UPI003B5C6A77